MAPDEIITSVRNTAVTDAVRLHRARARRESRLTLLEGPNLVSEALGVGLPIVELFVMEGEGVPEGAPVGYRVVSERVMRHMAGTITPRGPLAVVRIPEPSMPSDKRLLAAWGISDPGNCGTLLRTAAAFGYGYVSGPGSADPWSPKVLRSAAGGHFHTPVGYVDHLDALDGRPLVGTVVAGGEVPGSLPEMAVLLIGSEAHGLPDDVVAACDRLITIPTLESTESLNASVAGAIVAYLGHMADRD